MEKEDDKPITEKKNLEKVDDNPSVITKDKKQMTVRNKRVLALLVFVVGLVLAISGVIIFIL